MDLNEFSLILKNDQQIVNAYINDNLEESDELEKSVKYALADGKRIRPILFIETIKMLSDRKIDDNLLKFATALEKVHAYSLVHDDMPCMDNDDYRRGKLTVHKKFGEDLALLTGDYLLNMAFEDLFDLCNKNCDFLKPASYLCKCAGSKGMIYGQFKDLRIEKNYDLDYVLDVYSNKTAKLFQAAIVSAALYLKIEDERIHFLENFAKNLGLSFQLEDDLLEKSFENELNILNCLDRNEARDYLDEISEKAYREIEEFDNNDFFKYLITYLKTRKN